MPSLKYRFPSCLVGHCEEAAYVRWLSRKAAAHRKRDKARGNTGATIEQYKMAIHQAVERSGGVDAYTGGSLRWDLISKYNNEDSKAGRRVYKQAFGDLPSVDHVSDGLGAPDFAICAWRTNDAKNDLSYDEFISLCREVIEHSECTRGRVRVAAS